MGALGGRVLYLHARPMSERRADQDYLERANPIEQPVRFVSRSSAPSPPLGVDAEGAPLPRLRERGPLFVLLLAVLLQAFSWYQLEGYQLADSVEYMERAQAFASGEELQASGAVRSMGFSSLLVPFFAVADALGVQDLRPVVHVVRCFQMLLGLLLVLACMRLGARLGGRASGLAAGVVCALNPAFLQYSVSPVSGVAAALGIALALDLLIERTTPKRAALGGLALGFAFLMAYQTLLISGAILLSLLLRDRWAHIRHVLAIVGGFTLGILAQVVLDKISYGSWGVSIGNYLIENVGGVTLAALVRAGLGDQAWVRDLYEAYVSHMDGAIGAAQEGKEASLQPLGWYFSELPSMLVEPVMAIGIVGLLRSWKQATWKSSLLLLPLLISVGVMSLKGSKSFRLWLPLLPMIAPLCGWGWGALVGALDGAWGRTRRLAGAALLIAAAVLGLRALLEVNTRRYGIYWEAIEFVNEAAAAERAEAESGGGEWQRQRVSAAYHWAVFGRGSADLGVFKLSQHLDEWDRLDVEQRERLLHELRTSHWVVLHDAVLSLHSELTTALNEQFEVASTFWDEDAERGLRDVLVLRNVSHEDEAFAWSGRRARRMWEVVEASDPEVYRREQRLDRVLPVAQDFVGDEVGGRRERLTLLGWDYESLPSSDFGWITYHWYTPTGFEHDYSLIDRLTVPQMHSWWRNDHLPGRGFFPTSSWAPGSIVREGFVVLPGEDLFKDEFNPIGGDYRRGDLIPVTLWMKCRAPMREEEAEEEDRSAPTLFPVAHGSDERLEFFDAPGLADDTFESPDGHLAMRDGLVRIGEFLLPVGERFRVPDDGRPVED